MKRAASKKTTKTADKYDLLRKALRADGLEAPAVEDDSSYLDAVLGFANTLLNIRSFCQE